MDIQVFRGRRKLQIFAENRRKPQIGVPHLRCVTLWQTQILWTNMLWTSGFLCNHKSWTAQDQEEVEGSKLKNSRNSSLFAMFVHFGPQFGLEMLVLHALLHSSVFSLESAGNCCNWGVGSYFTTIAMFLAQGLKGVTRNAQKASRPNL